MSRRDTIIIAVLINTCLLAVLFMTAVHIDDDHIPDRFAVEQDIVIHHEESTPIVTESKQPAPAVSSDQYAVNDEIDRVLQGFAPQVVSPKPHPEVRDYPQYSQQEVESSVSIVEVTVKRGDSLGKIAQNNNTTVAAIKRENHLPTERIVVGQTLRVPVNTKKSAPSKPVVEMPQDQEFYTIKSGDNPWKIAKQFHVRFDELLELNHLDEQKARNLKAGDRLRVR